MPTGKQTDHQAINRLQIPHVDTGYVVTKAMEGDDIEHLLPPRAKIKYIVHHPHADCAPI
jgi:hypothetical protein